MAIKSRNIVAVSHRVTSAERAHTNKHTGGVLWFTGLPGSGKSTLALGLEQELFKTRHQVYVLDGDNIRAGLSSDLGFSPDDRTENIRRIGEVAALFADAGIIASTAFISPYQQDRDMARAAASKFYEIYVRADVETCESRDPKGHYKMARRGEIKEFTGISAPYEAPSNPDLIIDTGSQSIEESLSILIDFVEANF